MGKINWRGGALVAPVPPVMVSCGSDDKTNIITIAWTGIINTIPPKTYISVRPKRHSYNIIKESGEFVINLTPASLVRTADFCGIYTGAKVDKFKKCGLTPAPSAAVSCVSIAECPMSLECRVTDIIPLGSHDMFLADIVSVSVDESLIDEKGALHLECANLAAFAHGEYFELGKKLGSFGFSVRKNKKGKNVNKKGKAPHKG
ncbi:MAG: flavin reductase family protein [Clostridia bacterium]|nr:flavin reductase family protein [Clostridia bacterium]